MLEERPRDKIKTTADAIRAYEAAARRASEYEKNRVHSQQQARKDKASALDSSYPLLPLVFAILPAVASVLYGDIASGLLSDLLTLIVVGWILWSVSETSWKFYVNAYRHDLKARKAPAQASHAGPGDGQASTGAKSGLGVPGGPPSSAPASVSSGSNRAGFEPAAAPGSAPQPSTTATDKPPTRPHSKDQHHGMPSRYFAATVYLAAQVLGACIIHYARQNLSAGTKLVSNFNILLYLTVSLGRGLMRLNRYEPGRREVSSWVEADDHLRDYARLTGRVADLDTKISSNDAVWEREINEIWSAINHVAVQLSKVKQRERERERDRAGKLPKIDERTEEKKNEEKANAQRERKERKAESRDPGFRGDSSGRESVPQKEFLRREPDRRAHPEFRERVVPQDFNSQRGARLSRPGTASGTASASPTLYEFDPVNDAEKAGGDTISKTHVKAKQPVSPSPSPQPISLSGIIFAISRGVFSVPLVVCRTLVQEALRVVYVMLAKRFGQVEV